jgi:hypothetical protein
MTDTAMTCGHTANATATGMPACAICSCIDIAPEAPSIEGRMMVCCGDEFPSRRSAAFFSYRGPGSQWPQDTDEFYCGHAGWN